MQISPPIVPAAPVDIWTPLIAVCSIMTLLGGAAVFVLRLWFRAELAEFKLELMKEINARFQGQGRPADPPAPAPTVH
jgi:hypothetical protein